MVNGSPFPKQDLIFMCLQYKSFENTVGKGEIAHNSFAHKEQFLIFSQCFGKLAAIFIKFEIVVCKLYQFERV